MSPVAEAEWGISSDKVGQLHAEYGEQLVQSLAARNRTVAPEAMQEVWLGLLQHSPPGEVLADSRRLFAWLLIAVRRRAVDLVRRERLRAHLSLDVQCAQIAGDELVRAELVEGVRRILNDLAANASGSAPKLLEMRFLEGQSVAEIAHLLTVSPRTASSRLQRAMRKFRAAWIATSRGGVATELFWIFFWDFRVTFPRLVRLPCVMVFFPGGSP